jgi:hypothetical protein
LLLEGNIDTKKLIEKTKPRVTVLTQCYDSYNQTSIEKGRGERSNDNVVQKTKAAGIVTCRCDDHDKAPTCYSGYCDVFVLTEIVRI